MLLVHVAIFVELVEGTVPLFKENLAISGVGNEDNTAANLVARGATATVDPQVVAIARGIVYRLATARPAINDGATETWNTVVNNRWPATDTRDEVTPHAGTVGQIVKVVDTNVIIHATFSAENDNEEDASYERLKSSSVNKYCTLPATRFS